MFQPFGAPVVGADEIEEVEITAIVRKYDLLIVEQAAHAIDARYRGQMAPNAKHGIKAVLGVGYSLSRG